MEPVCMLRMLARWAFVVCWGCEARLSGRAAGQLAEQPTALLGKQSPEAYLVPDCICRFSRPVLHRLGLGLPYPLQLDVDCTLQEEDVNRFDTTESAPCVGHVPGPTLPHGGLSRSAHPGG